MPASAGFCRGPVQLSVVSTQAILSGKDYAVNMVTDVAIEEDAHVQLYADCLRSILKIFGILMLSALP